MKRGSVQNWIETTAERPAFILALLCMVARASAFYSGGSLAIASILGARGLTVFNDVSGIGLAVGCELLSSIAGRAWQRAKAEVFEVAGRRGTTRVERQAMIAHARSKARLSLTFMVIGIAASFLAAFSFLQSTSTSHSFIGDLSEVVIVGLLISVLLYLGVFREPPTEDASEIATTHARTVRSRIIEEAGKRLATGTYSSHDAMLIAGGLPRQERDRFLSATLTSSIEDPLWKVADIMDWLGVETGTARRIIVRKLAKMAADGQPVTKDDKGAYMVPKSIAGIAFMTDFTRIARGQAVNPSSRVSAIRVVPRSESDNSETKAGQIGG